MTETTTTSLKIHWSFVVFVTVISFLCYYGCTHQNALQTPDNKHFIKKIDSLENQIQNYEQRAEQERIYRNELYHKKDSLENIIVLYGLYLPSLQELKRTSPRQKP